MDQAQPVPMGLVFSVYIGFSNHNYTHMLSLILATDHCAHQLQWLCQVYNLLIRVSAFKQVVCCYRLQC